MESSTLDSGTKIELPSPVQKLPSSPHSGSSSVRRQSSERGDEAGDVAEDRDDAVTTGTASTAVPPARLTELPGEELGPQLHNEKSLSRGDNSQLENAPETPVSAPALGGEYPDGGIRAWLVVLGAWCISFISWGFSNSFGVFQSYYSENILRDESPDAIAWIGSFQLAMVLACGIVAGKAFDAGYIRYLLFGGTLLYTAGLFGLSYAEEYYQIFLAQGVACGFACGVCVLPAVSSVSHWFRVRRATALGILATGSSIGGIVYPLILNNCFRRIGFAWTVRATGFLTLGLLLIACATIQTRLPPRRGGRIVDFRHFKDPAYSFYVVAASLIIWGLYTPYFYIQEYAEQNNVASNVSFYSLSILNAASLFGRVIPNWLADTYGPFVILIPNCALSGVLIFAFLGLCRSTAGTIVFCLLFGFSSGAYVSMLPACIASLTDRDKMNEIGIRIAMIFLVTSLFALTGTPIAGAIVTHENGGFVGAAVFSGVVVLAGTCSCVVAWWIISRRKGTIWV